MAIEKVLTLSTAHMHPDTDCILNELKEGDSLKDLLPRYIKTNAHEYGWLFFISLELKETINTKDFVNKKLTDLASVFLYAVDQGCIYVNFDRDADIIDDLIQYDWTQPG